MFRAEYSGSLSEVMKSHSTSVAISKSSSSWSCSIWQNGPFCYSFYMSRSLPGVKVYGLGKIPSHKNNMVCFLFVGFDFADC